MTHCVLYGQTNTELGDRAGAGHPGHYECDLWINTLDESIWNEEGLIEICPPIMEKSKICHIYISS